MSQPLPPSVPMTDVQDITAVHSPPSNSSPSPASSADLVTRAGQSSDTSVDPQRLLVDPPLLPTAAVDSLPTLPLLSASRPAVHAETQGDLPLSDDAAILNGETAAPSSSCDGHFSAPSAAAASAATASSLAHLSPFFPPTALARMAALQSASPPSIARPPASRAGTAAPPNAVASAGASPTVAAPGPVPTPTANPSVSSPPTGEAVLVDAPSGYVQPCLAHVAALQRPTLELCDSTDAAFRAFDRRHIQPWLASAECFLVSTKARHAEVKDRRRELSQVIQDFYDKMRDLRAAAFARGVRTEERTQRERGDREERSGRGSAGRAVEGGGRSGAADPLRRAICGGGKAATLPLRR